MKHIDIIDIFEKKEKSESAVMRSFEDINNQINLYVDEIRELSPVVIELRAPV